LRNFAVSLIQC